MDSPDETLAAASVGAVIVHFHRERDVARLVQKLTARDGIAPEHVVVVDNGSTDDLLAVALKERAVAPLVLQPGNVGYAAGMNLGVAAMPDDVGILVLLTHEVELAEGALDLLVAEVTEDPRAVVGPLLVTDEGRVWSAGGLLRGVRRLPAHRRAGADPATVTGRLPCAWLDGAAVVLSKATWSTVGGLDERYFLYAEDIDLGLRAAAAGHPVRVVGDARASQAPSSSIDPYLWTRNPFLLFRAHRLRMPWILWLASCLVGIARDVVTARARRTQVPRRIVAVREGVAGRSGPPSAASRPAQRASDR